MSCKYRTGLSTVVNRPFRNLFISPAVDRTVIGSTPFQKPPRNRARNPLILQQASRACSVFQNDLVFEKDSDSCARITLQAARDTGATEVRILFSNVRRR
jgi:hypothetical protein